KNAAPWYWLCLTISHALKSSKNAKSKKALYWYKNRNNRCIYSLGHQNCLICIEILQGQTSASNNSAKRIFCYVNRRSEERRVGNESRWGSPRARAEKNKSEGTYVHL